MPDAKPLPSRQTVLELLCRAETLPPDRRRADVLTGFARRHVAAEREAAENSRRGRPRRWRP